MANRSDFLTAKLPRSLKKMIALIPNLDARQSREIRKIFIDAHARHVRAKTRRSDEVVVAGDAAEAV